MSTANLVALVLLLLIAAYTCGGGADFGAGIWDLFAGDKDLSTPMEWAQAAVKHAPSGKLIVAKGAGHGVQSQGDEQALAALRALVASLG